MKKKRNYKKDFKSAIVEILFECLDLLLRPFVWVARIIANIFD